MEKGKYQYKDNKCNCLERASWGVSLQFLQRRASSSSLPTSSRERGTSLWQGRWHAVSIEICKCEEHAAGTANIRSAAGVGPVGGGLRQQGVSPGAVELESGLEERRRGYIEMVRAIALNVPLGQSLLCKGEPPLLSTRHPQRGGGCRCSEVTTVCK